jgi:DNA-binding LacI/PurR family transcriptional regulator
MPGLKEIADRTGLSLATVSRALNDSPLVNEVTKKKVQSAAQELDYVRNHTAASLRTGKSDIIVYALPRLDYVQGYFHTSILAEVEKVTAEEKHKLLLTEYPNDIHQLRGFLSSVRKDSRMGGILLVTDNPSDDLLNAFRAFDGPFVLVNCFPEQGEDWDEIPCVGTTNVEGGLVATESLINLGHRKIAFISQIKGVRDGYLRFMGYKRALKKYDIEYDENLLVECAFVDGEEGGRQAAYNLFSKVGRNLSAIVAGNDEIAVGVIQALKRMHISVPQEVSVVGFDNQRWDDYVEPTLTSIEHGAIDIGRTAADLLFKQIEGIQKDSPHQIVFRSRLVFRQSIARLKS